MIERRRFRRIIFKEPIDAEVEYNNEKINIKITNIGEKGFEFICDKKSLSINNMIITKILDKYSNYDPFISKISWVRETEKKVTCGTEFTKYSDNNLELLEKIFVDNGKKLFAFKKIVYIGDTNLEGNVYFAKYVDWQGMAREELWRKSYPLDFLKEKIILITVEAHISYKYPLFLYDEVLIFVNTSNIKKTTFDLVFSYVNKNNGKLIAEGTQTIGFSDFNGKFLPVPDSVVKEAQLFLIK
ncbi:MAG: acyl-CoA thioesterase [Endomicrobiia bacterium]